MEMRRVKWVGSHLCAPVFGKVPSHSVAHKQIPTHGTLKNSNYVLTKTEVGILANIEMLPEFGDIYKWKLQGKMSFLQTSIISIFKLGPGEIPTRTQPMFPALLR